VRKDSCKYTLQDGFVNRRPMLRGEESSRDFTCAPSKPARKKEIRNDHQNRITLEEELTLGLTF
jgi:hypothetical protein